MHNCADTLAAVDLEEHLARHVQRMRWQLVELEDQFDEAVFVREELDPFGAGLRREDCLQLGACLRLLVAIADKLRDIRRPALAGRVVLYDRDLTCGAAGRRIRSCARSGGNS